MATTDFFLSYEAHSGASVEVFRRALENAPAKVVANVTIGELCAMSDHPNGLYFFFGGIPRVLQYVGKCTSRSFVERVPSHFDQREGAWFATLPTKLAANGMSYPTALATALQFQCVLLGVRAAQTTSRLERVFRHSYQPHLNTPRNILPFDTGRTLEHFAGADA
jgi:hypothetical protein